MVAEVKWRSDIRRKRIHVHSPDERLLTSAVGERQFLLSACHSSSFSNLPSRDGYASALGDPDASEPQSPEMHGRITTSSPLLSGAHAILARGSQLHNIHCAGIHS